MVAMQLRSFDYMPPTRYIIRLDPETEPLHALLRRLREERGWTQYELAARVDPERADDAQAMRNLQVMLSRYETGKMSHPDELLLEKLEVIYDLPTNELILAGVDTARRRKRPETLFAVRAQDVDKVRRFARFLEEDHGEDPDDPSFEERVQRYARYLSERNQD